MVQPKTTYTKNPTAELPPCTVVTPYNPKKRKNFGGLPVLETFLPFQDPACVYSTKTTPSLLTLSTEATTYFKPI